MIPRKEQYLDKPKTTIPELVYPFVCVLAPCTISKQLVCAHPIYQADLGGIRDAIGSVYPHPQYNTSTIQRYKQDELELERARKAKFGSLTFSRWTDAPDWMFFQEGQRKLADRFGRALRGGRKSQSDPSRSAGRSNRFDKLERPDPRLPRSKYVDPFSGAPGLEGEQHQGQRQKSAVLLQELRRSRGETTPLKFCSRIRDLYSELDPNSQQQLHTHEASR